MDPTQDQVETRKLMASVKLAVDKIVTDFSLRQQAASSTEPSITGK